MGDELLIDVQGVSKRFCRSLRRSLRYATADLFRELLTGRRPAPDLRPGEFWAVNDVSVRLRRGEALGLVGRNGAGKTTLLRMIAGLIRPDAGVVRTRGRVVPLLALGAGFNPVLSGRENIAVNMSILGMPRAEIRRRLDEVIAFAELPADALDAPVRTYSSGMSARLGFACAIHTDPDVLLIDEVLAVGDMAFRAKCYRKLAALRVLGTGFILVSHSSHMVASACDTALYLTGGRTTQVGPVVDVMNQYEEDLSAAGSDHAAPNAGTSRGASPRPTSDSTFHIEGVRFEDDSGNTVVGPKTGEPVTICVRCRCTRPATGIGFVALLRDNRGIGEYVLNLNSQEDGRSLDFPEGLSEARLKMDPCGLVPGFYFAKLFFVRRPMHMLDVIEYFPFRVTTSAPARECRFYQPRDWEVVGITG